MSRLMDALKRSAPAGQAAALNARQLSAGQPERSETETEIDTDAGQQAPLVDGLHLPAAPPPDEAFPDAPPGEDDPLLSQETLPGEEAGPGVSALPFARPAAAHELPMPVSDRTVFAAYNTRKTAAVYAWAALGASALCSVAAAWYYHAVTPMHSPLPSAQALKGIESALFVQTQPLQQSPAVAVGERTVPVAENPAKAQAAGADADADAVSAAEVAQHDRDAGVVAGSATPASSSEAAILPAAAARTASVAQDFADETAPTAFTITRSGQAASNGNDNGNNKAIHAAYAAYREGRLELARALYTDILNSAPANRDALLGLGALALHAGEKGRAAMFYAALLRRNPQDSLARAMLMSLHKQLGHEQLAPPDSISQLKTLLRRNPQQAALHFSLGNVYAGQGRWAAAQQAFSAAWGLDTANPDYALNLAISLDQLGQHASALEHYQLALSLAAAAAVQFDRAAIQRRISVLSKGK